MDPKHIITAIEAYSKATGLKPTTICQLALGNARYFDRLTARKDRLPKEWGRIKAYIDAHPAKTEGAEQ